jgi:hypothetical protein
MNKIEKAIYDVELHKENKEREILISKTEFNTLVQQLKMLKNIQSDDSVPYYSNDKSNITEKP